MPFDFKVVIPARYKSHRLPGKVLLDLCGKPMLQRVWEKAIEIVSPENVIIATDSATVANTAEGFGARTMITSDFHRSGTERLLEVAENIGGNPNDIFVNLQADEPLIPPDLILQVAENLRVLPGADVTTLYDKIVTREELFNPDIVKVVTDKDNYALYFSRAPIPYYREGPQGFNNGLGRRHIGLYAYRLRTLRRYSREFAPCYLEKVELLEQLRLIFFGLKIHLDYAVECPEQGVDTQEDLDRVRLTLGLLRGIDKQKPREI